MNVFRFQLLTVALLMTFSSCTRESKNSVSSSESDLARCYAQLLVLQEEARIARWDSTTTRQRRDSLLSSFSLSSELLKEALLPYTEDHTRWRLFSAKVSEEIGRMKRDDQASQ